MNIVLNCWILLVNQKSLLCPNPFSLLSSALGCAFLADLSSMSSFVIGY